jgi:hypothetical protein
MEHIDPINKITPNDFILIAEKSWPKNHFREISEIDVIKTFYNDSYQNFHEQIEIVLDKFHPASWVRVAYIQLELYSLELHKAHIEKKDLSSVPYLFIPIARYGWRYIIEKSLEKLENYDSSEDYCQRPDEKSINKIFTFLIGLNYTNELSNYLHFFKDKINSIRIVFSSYLYGTFPELGVEERKFFDNMIEYISQEVNYSEVPEFDFRNNQILLTKINNFLMENFNFVLDDIDSILNILKDKVSVKIGASNLIIPTNELIILLSEYSSLEPNIIGNIVDFIFLDTKSFAYQERDFLRKSQSIRMLNYSGCKFQLTKNLETIYDDESKNWEHIKSASHHSIISFIVMAEWHDNFISRLSFGQRTDLKNISAKINNEVSKIEDYFHKNIFETGIKNIFINNNVPCISIEKVNKQRIPCGEIDGVSVDEKNKIIYVLEAKNTSPSRDARAFANNIKDHFEQKKYHSKFLKKINWVKNNLNSISELFEIPISNEFKIETYFITGNPSPIKFLVQDYLVLTYYEFNKLINERYRRN